MSKAILLQVGFIDLRETEGSTTDTSSIKSCGHASWRGAFQSQRGSD